jgi:hypothetical protein
MEHLVLDLDEVAGVEEGVAGDEERIRDCLEMRVRRVVPMQGNKSLVWLQCLQGGHHRPFWANPVRRLW